MEPWVIVVGLVLCYICFAIGHIKGEKKGREEEHRELHDYYIRPLLNVGFDGESAADWLDEAIERGIRFKQDGEKVNEQS